MAINPAFRGHGLFCYMPDEIARYYRNYPSGFGRSRGLIERVAGWFGSGLGGTVATTATGFGGALKDMGITHAWVRLFGLEGLMPEAPTKDLIAETKGAGVHVAGWGYCHGRDPASELDQAITQADKFGLDAFIADIEPGRELGGTKSKWELQAFNDFVGGLSRHFGVDNLGISTWPVLKVQNDPEFPSLSLMQIAANRVAMFAPQAYWMSYPTKVHYDATGFSPADYPRNDPVSFVRLVVDSWRADGFQQPLVVTGQGYWGEGGPPQTTMEMKVSSFVMGFADWPKIVAFNWWHAGGDGFAMSPAMIAAIAQGKLADKPFASTSAPGTA